MSTNRKKPLQARSKNTVNSILTASRQILLNDGVLKFSTNTIAKKSGVSVGSIYQYFQSKEKILDALLEIELSISIKKLEENLDKLSHQSLEEKLGGFLKNISNMFAENEYLLQAQTILNKCENFNIDQFFETEILTRSKKFFSFDENSLLSSEIENFLLLTKHSLLPSIATPDSQTINLLNNFAKNIVQSNTP